MSNLVNNRKIYVIKYGALYLYENGNMFTIELKNARIYKSSKKAHAWIRKNCSHYPHTSIFKIIELEI